MPQGLVVIHTGEALSLTTDVPVRSFQSPCGNECVSGVKDILSETPTALPVSIHGHAEPTDTYEDLPLSPVM